MGRIVTVEYLEAPPAFASNQRVSRSARLSGADSKSGSSIVSRNRPESARRDCFASSTAISQSGRILLETFPDSHERASAYLPV